MGLVVRVGWQQLYNTPHLPAPASHPSSIVYLYHTTVLCSAPYPSSLLPLPPQILNTVPHIHTVPPHILSSVPL